MSTMIVPMRRAMPEHSSLDRVRGNRTGSPLGIPCEPDCLTSVCQAGERRFRRRSFLLFVLAGRFVVEDSLLEVLDPRSQVVGFARLVHDLVFLDQALLPEVEKALVEQDHAVLAAGLDRRVDAVRLVLAD